MMYLQLFYPLLPVMLQSNLPGMCAHIYLASTVIFWLEPYVLAPTLCQCSGPIDMNAGAVFFKQC